MLVVSVIPSRMLGSIDCYSAVHVNPRKPVAPMNTVVHFSLLNVPAACAQAALLQLTNSASTQNWLNCVSGIKDACLSFCFIGKPKIDLGKNQIDLTPLIFFDSL